METKKTSAAVIWAFITALALIVGLIADSMGILDFLRNWGIECRGGVTPPSTSSVPTEDEPDTTGPLIYDDIHYEYRKMEYIESNNASLSGWTQYKHTDVQAYGEFSAWQYDPVAEDSSTDVQTTTHYRWRRLAEETTTGEWSAWTTERRQNIASNVEERVENYPLYGYYYFECPNCGFHMHVYDTNCASYAGGCGQFIPDDSGWHSIYLELPWDEANLQDWHGTGHFYTIINGERWFKWQYGDNMSTGTRYSYRETSIQYTPTTDWQYTSEKPDSSYGLIESQEVTAYRSSPIYKTTTYYYWRWSEWMKCTEDQYYRYENDDDKEVRVTSD